MYYIICIKQGQSSNEPQQTTGFGNKSLNIKQKSKTKAQWYTDKTKGW